MNMNFKALNQLMVRIFNSVITMTNLKADA